MDQHKDERTKCNNLIRAFFPEFNVIPDDNISEHLEFLLQCMKDWLNSKEADELFKLKPYYNYETRLR